MALNGKMDMSRSDGVNQQNHTVSKLSRKKPLDTLAPDGTMDLSRPDSINQQKILAQKSPRKKPNDTLAPQGDMDFSKTDIPVFENNSRRNSLDESKFFKESLTKGMMLLRHLKFGSVLNLLVKNKALERLLGWI